MLIINDTIEIDVTQKFKVLHNAQIPVDFNGKSDISHSLSESSNYDKI